MKACIELEHTTWKMNEGSKNYSATDANVGAAVRLMGYNLTVDNAYFKDTASGTTAVGVQIRNTGVAPFYYPWAVTLGLKDSSGAVVRTWDTPWDLRTVMPTKIRAFPEWGTEAYWQRQLTDLYEQIRILQAAQARRSRGSTLASVCSTVSLFW